MIFSLLQVSQLADRKQKSNLYTPACFTMACLGVDFVCVFGFLVLPDLTIGVFSQLQMFHSHHLPKWPPFCILV